LRHFWINNIEGNAWLHSISYDNRFHDPRGTFARKPMLREAAVNLRVFFPHALGEVLLTTVETFADESGKCDLERAASTLGDKLDLKSASQPSDLASPWDDASVWRAKEATMAHSNFIMRIVHFIEDKVQWVSHTSTDASDRLFFVSFQCCVYAYSVRFGL